MPDVPVVPFCTVNFLSCILFHKCTDCFIQLLSCFINCILIFLFLSVLCQPQPVLTEVLSSCLLYNLILFKAPAALIAFSSASVDTSFVGSSGVAASSASIALFRLSAALSTVSWLSFASSADFAFLSALTEVLSAVFCII